MPIWTDEYLLELQSRGEIDLTTDVPCIFDRFSLEVTSGTSSYDLPDGILSIIRITWKGKKVWPYDNRSSLAAGIHLNPLTETTVGTPYLYLQHNYGFDKIYFFPTPDESISADDSGIWGTDIANRVVVSCWKVADPTSNLLRLPDFVRRRLIKYYVNMKAYAKEGPSQDTEAASYFQQKYELSKAHLRSVVNRIPRSVVQQFQPQNFNRPTIGRPRLPSNFGRIVE